MPDGIFVSDRDGRIAFLNQQAEAMCGYVRQELIGRPIEALVPAAARLEHIEHRRRYYESGPAPRPMGTHLDIHVRRKDGTEFPADISLGPVRLGHRLLVVAAVRDVSERRRTQARLRQAEERYRRLVEGVSDHAIFMLDAEGRVTRRRSWTGLSPSSTLRRPRIAPGSCSGGPAARVGPRMRAGRSIGTGSGSGPTPWSPRSWTRPGCSAATPPSRATPPSGGAPSRASRPPWRSPRSFSRDETAQRCWRRWRPGPGRWWTPTWPRSSWPRARTAAPSGWRPETVPTGSSACAFGPRPRPRSDSKPRVRLRTPTSRPGPPCAP